MSNRAQGFARLSLFSLFFVIGVILWGALVRATGSGAGCGEHWPLCNGEMLPSIARYQTAIELTHRVTSGASLLLVLALWLRSRSVFPKGHEARRFAAISAVGIVIEAAIGAALVLLRLVEHDASLDRAISIALHLVNTCLLVGALALTWRATGQRPDEVPGPGKRSGAIWLAGFVVLAAAGAWTALGDTLFAVSSFQEGWVRDWARDAHFLERLRIVHPVLAVGWVAGTVPWLLEIRRQPAASRWATRALVLMVANLVIGGLNVLLAAPLALQILHLAVANGLWVALVLCWYQTGPLAWTQTTPTP
jgi:cytochrome c oxidase assembly protein subunit 15